MKSQSSPESSSGTCPDGVYPYTFNNGSNPYAFIFPYDEGRHSIVESPGEIERALVHHPVQLLNWQFAHGHPSPLEWWYIVSHLQDKAGNRFFIFLCWFSNGSLQLGITDIDGEGRWTFSKKFPLREIRMEDRYMYLNFGGNCLENVAPFRYRADVNVDGQVKICLEYCSKRPPFGVGKDENGNTGFFHFPHGGYTWYYTMSRLETEGKVILDDREILLKGISWMDRQWGAFSPVTDWRWEWMAIQLTPDKEVLNHFGRIADINAWNIKGTCSDELIWDMATVLKEDGNVEFMNVRMIPLDYWKSPQGYIYSHGWKVVLYFNRCATPPLYVFPDFPDQTQKMAARFSLLSPQRKPEFWEGQCSVYLDERRRRKVGVATVELTKHYSNFLGG